MENVTQPRENCKRIKGSIYLVRTQAGFRSAARRFRDGDKELEVRGYPRSYPSVVFFSMGYSGDLFVRADVIHVKTLRAALEDE